MTLKKHSLMYDLIKKEVVEKIGVSREAIPEWEREITYPIPPNIDKLCELYDTNYTIINFYTNIPFNGINKHQMS